MVPLVLAPLVQRPGSADGGWRDWADGCIGFGPKGSRKDTCLHSRIRAKARVLMEVPPLTSELMKRAPGDAGSQSEALAWGTCRGCPGAPSRIWQGAQIHHLTTVQGMGRGRSSPASHLSDLSPKIWGVTGCPASQKSQKSPIQFTMSVAVTYEPMAEVWTKPVARPRTEESCARNASS